MKTLIKTTLSALALLVLSLPAQAGFGFITDAATIDDVTTTACTTAPNQDVTGFGNGVSAEVPY